MSVSVVENWSDVTGEITDWEPSSEVEKFTVLTILVREVNEVEGFPNLLDKAVDKPLKVHVPEALAGSFDLATGATVTCRVRRATLTRSFVHPHHFSVQHSPQD